MEIVEEKRHSRCFCPRWSHGPAQSLPRSLTIGLTQTINISLMTLSDNFQKPHFRSTTTCAETKELKKMEKVCQIIKSRCWNRRAKGILHNRQTHESTAAFFHFSPNNPLSIQITNVTNLLGLALFVRSPC